MTPRTRAGFLKIRPVRPGATVALVALASPFSREAFDRGVAELRRLGFAPAWDERVFAADPSVPFTSGAADLRRAVLHDTLADPSVAAIVAVRGGYGSVEVLPGLDLDTWRQRRTAFVGYSDLTSLHVALNGSAAAPGLVTLHGPMVEGRLANGPAGYEPTSFLTALLDHPVGELRPDGVEVLRPGAEIRGPVLGGTLTQLAGSMGTPFAFDPPAGHVLFIDEVGERPYRLRRLLMQLRLSGVLAKAAAVVFNELPRCDEPGGTVTAKATVHAALRDFPGPVLFGLPSGHTPGELVTVPFGVEARVMTSARPGLVIDEAAASD